MIQRIFSKLIILAILLFTTTSVAQSFNYTTSIADTNGAYLTNKAVTLQISLIENDIHTEPVYVEKHSSTTNNFGITNIQVGTGSTVSGLYSQVDWSKRVFIKSEYAINGASELITISTSEITAAPISIYSQVANSLVIESENGSRWNISADNNGNLVSSLVNPTEIEYGTVDYIFDNNALPTITLELTTEQWNQLLTNFDNNPHNEDCVAADFTFNKNGTIHKLENIGLRLRGNTSRVRPEGSYGQAHNPNNPDWHHCHFGFRFEKFVDGDNLLSGTDRFNLRWAHEDPTYVHEVYSYDLLRRFGVYTTLKSSYCRLEIKITEDNSTAYYGIYEMFEAADDQYFDDREDAGLFAGDKGYLWKMGWGSGVGAFLTADQANPNLMGYEDIGNFTYDYKSKKKNFEAARTQLVQFITDLNRKTGAEFEQWAEANINIDLLLRAYAVTVAVGQWDGYWGNGNNFYLYFDEDGVCDYIPYDFDNALGTTSSGIVGNPGTQDPLNWGSNNRPLITKVLEVERWRNQYKKYLLELASPENDYLDADKSKTRILRWHSLIQDHVANDTGEDEHIIDKPASWSSIQNYRLLSGDDNGTNNGGDANFFKTRVKAINQYCK